jgi:tungstate transport system substrate-binding protein
MRRSVAAVLVGLAILSCGDDDSDQSGSGNDKGQMILATTTSTQDSGLLDELVPRFEDESGCSVKTVAVGSGEALELAEKGNADVLLVHSPEAEEEFMDGGHGVSRKAVMHNDFVVVGPADDAAKIKGAGSAADAFTRIAKAQAPFASRADESGTNTKELAIWEAAGIEPKGDWYIEPARGWARRSRSPARSRPIRSLIAALGSQPTTSISGCWSRAATTF